MVGWFIAIALITLMVFLPQHRMIVRWNTAGVVAFQGLQRNLFSLGVTWIMFACISGRGSKKLVFFLYSYFCYYNKHKN